MINKLTFAATTLGLFATPIAANASPFVANPAASLSVSAARASTQTSNSSKLAGLQEAGIVPIVIGIGILAGVTYLIVDHEDDNNSDSN